MSRKRRYTQTQRAQNQAATRRRIVEATVALHGELGPVHTSISAVAERAGVQRHTVYAHFPTERDLALACSGLALERDPLPDERPWREIADPQQRLRRGLSEIYAWYGRNAQLASCVMRDAEIDPLTRDMVRLRIGSRMQVLEKVLGQGLRSGRAADAALRLALSFQTWRLLVKEEGLSPETAVEFMIRAIDCAGEKSKKSARA